MEYPSNSNNQGINPDKTNPKKIEPVVKGEVVRRKKPMGKRFKEIFAVGNVKNVWGYVMFEVLVPAGKDMIADAGNTFVERILFGDSRPSSRRTGNRHGGASRYTNYGEYSKSSLVRRDEPRNMSRRARASHDFDEIILNTRVEAEEVIEHIFERIEKYDVASVADLYDLVGVTGDYTDRKWGWIDFRGAHVSHIREGYLLNLPRPEPIDN